MKTTLHNDDCLSVMKSISTGSIDLILCDLPYGTTKCEWDIRINESLLWDEYNRIIKENGAIILFAKQPFTTDLINSNRSQFRYIITWMKNIASGFLNAKIRPLGITEDILVFYAKKPTYNPQMESGFKRKQSSANAKKKCKATEIYGKATEVKDYDSDERYPVDVIYFESDKHTCCLHPTQKPVALLEYLIKTYSNEGDVVLDNCMGSGSTGVACLNTNRDFIGIELSKEYYDIARQRISNTTASSLLF